MRRLLRARLESASAGQAAVETALILSIVMLLGLATLDVGRGIAAHLALTEATQEGAMVAGYRHCAEDDDDVNGPPLDEADIADLVTTSSSAEAVTEAVVTIDGVTDDYVTVRSEYPMPIITPVASFIFGPTIGIAVEVDATNLHDEC